METKTAPKTIEHLPVDSSNIASYGHDAETKTLEVTFKGPDGTPGATYRYLQVPVLTVMGLRDAPSKGKYFSRNIKPYYRGEKV